MANKYSQKALLGPPMLVQSIILITLYFLGALWVPPFMHTDQGWGFLASRSMRMGGPFNHVYTPLASDISIDTSFFETTWTPGQYFFPELFRTMGFNLGTSMTLTVFIVSLAGLIGAYLLFRKLGFSEKTASLTVLIMACMRWYAMPFGVFTGGQVIMDTLSPWFAVAVLSIRKKMWAMLLLFPLICLVGTFIKLAFMILTLSFSVFVFISEMTEHPSDKNSNSPIFGRAILKSFGGFLIYVLIMLFLFFSRGDLPASIKPPSQGWELSGLFFTVAGPFISFLSLEDLYNRIFSTGRSFRDIHESVWVFLFFAITAVLTYRAVLTNKTLPRSYRIFAGSVVSVFCISLSYFFCLTSSISFGARYFLPAGIVLAPGMIQTLLNTPSRILKRGLFAVIVMLCVYGVASYPVRSLHNIKMDVVGRLGFSQSDLTKEEIRWVNLLDQALHNKNTLFYFTNPVPALEVEKSRVMSSLAGFESLQQLKDRSYKGEVDNLIVFIPWRLPAEKGEAILRSFRSYGRTDWKICATDNSRFFWQGISDSEIENICRNGTS